MFSRRSGRTICKPAIRRLCAGALGLAVGVSQVSATPPPFDANPAAVQRKSDDERGREALADLVTCLAIESPKTVKSILEEPFYSENFGTRFSALMNRRCERAKRFNGSATVPPLVVRGMFYEYFFRNEYLSIDVAKLSSLAPLSYPTAANSQSVTQQYRLLMIVGDCLVRKSPVLARTLVVAEMGSTEEAKSIGAIARLVPACVPNHESLRLSRSILRAMIAEPLYRLSSESERTQP